MGYDAGKIDGKIGDPLRAAVRAFQERNGLAPDGYPDLALLKQVSASRCPASRDGLKPPSKEWRCGVSPPLPAPRGSAAPRTSDGHAGRRVHVEKARKADRYPHNSTHNGAVVSFKSVGGSWGRDMHRVAKAHLEDFVTKYDVDGKETKQFETFLNYVIFRTHCAENVDPRDLVYDGDDPGIDGVMIFIDDGYVSSVDEVEEAMKGRRRDTDVTVVFTQAKTSKSWSKAEINVFEFSD